MSYQLGCMENQAAIPANLDSVHQILRSAPFHKALASA